MKRNLISLFATSLCATVLLASCTKDNMMGTQNSDGMEEVNVSIDLRLAPLNDVELTGTKGTFIDGTTDKEINSIKNLWIIQFAGTEDSSKRIGNPIYIEEYTSSNMLKLIASSENNRIVFVANTFARNIAFGDCVTLADAKALARTISSESDMIHTEIVDGVTQYYPVMNGYTDIRVQSGITVSCELKHSMAKIDIKVDNQVSGLTIESVTMVAPSRFNYLTNCPSVPDIYPELRTFSSIAYATTLWGDGKVDESAHKFTFYTPANKRGTVSLDTHDGKYKGDYAPEKSTYAVVAASYIDQGGIKRGVTYTFYLGSNLTNDYNIHPNGHYSYRFTINDIGDQDTDGRVEYDLVDFCKKNLANSYIINPPVIEGSWKNFRIPVKRVYDFWRVDGKYEDNSDYAEPADGWVVDVIWSEFPIDDEHFKWVTKNKTTKLDPNNDYFEFQIKAGVKGNCVIGLRRYTNATMEIDTFCLWSWQMWVTDYRPDKAKLYTPETGRYVYSVPGGDVHRYNNDIFNSGVYSDKFIMDRNLGSMDVGYHADDGRFGVIFYQFGRKDPFPGPRNVYIFHQDDNSYSYDSWNVTEYRKPYDANVENHNNVPYSIHNPLIFIVGGSIWNGFGYWTGNDIYNPSQYDPSIRWQDPYVKSTDGKSIFDPCPAGWKVPEIDVWRDFTLTNTVWSSESTSQGRYYYPNGVDDKTTGSIFLPFHKSIYFNYTNLSQMNLGAFAEHFGSTPKNKGKAYHTIYGSANMTVYQALDHGDKGYGMSVRCVQE